MTRADPLALTAPFAAIGAETSRRRWFIPAIIFAARRKFARGERDLFPSIQFRWKTG
jgi:hypothetical protein